MGKDGKAASCCFFVLVFLGSQFLMMTMPFGPHNRCKLLDPKHMRIGLLNFCSANASKLLDEQPTARCIRSFSVVVLWRSPLCSPR